MHGCIGSADRRWSQLPAQLPSGKLDCPGGLGMERGGGDLGPRPWRARRRPMSCAVIATLVMRMRPWHLGQVVTSALKMCFSYCTFRIGVELLGSLGLV